MTEFRTVAFHTLGCKVNQYETEAMAKIFREKGYEIVNERDFADVYVINTCTVTAVADKKSRQYVRRMKKVNPDSIVVVTGCYSQISPEEVRQIKGIDIITGTNEKKNIPEYVENFISKNAMKAEASGGEVPTEKSTHAGDVRTAKAAPAGEVHTGESACTIECGAAETEMYVNHRDNLTEFIEMGPAASTENRTRAYIKVQEGCDRFCSYCVIPYARGTVRSRPLENIVEEAGLLLQAGYKELVLTGINTAQYDMEGRNLYSANRSDVESDRESDNEPGSASDKKCGNISGSEAVKLPEEIFGIEKVIAALNDMPGDFRIRLSSLEPAVVNSEYVKRLFKYDKLCHHLHMSAQSGSNSILKAMNRPYDIDGYYDMVNTLFEFDECYGISTDIIVGFPGETDRDFEDSCNLVIECCFCKTHIFKYSKRPLTKAAVMAGQVSPQIKNKRSDELEAVAKLVAAAFREINLAAAAEGRTERVLIEEVQQLADGKEYYTGYTGNYIRAYIPAENNSRREDMHNCGNLKLNEFVEVRLKEIFRDGMIAEPV